MNYRGGVFHSGLSSFWALICNFFEEESKDVPRFVLKSIFGLSIGNSLALVIFSITAYYNYYNIFLFLVPAFALSIFFVWASSKVLSLLFDSKDERGK